MQPYARHLRRAGQRHWAVALTAAVVRTLAVVALVAIAAAAVAVALLIARA